MKNKAILILTALLTTALLLFGTGIVAARSLEHGIPPNNSEGGSDPDEDELWGSMHRMGWYGDEDMALPPMMEAMVDALAEELNLSREEILTQLEGGKHLYDVAMDAGLSAQEFFNLMRTIREDVFSDERGNFRYYRSQQLPYHTPRYSGDDGSFFPPCHGWDDQPSPMNGGPSRNGGRGW